MESQPQNPVFRINHENFSPMYLMCMQALVANYKKKKNKQLES